jgi:hypothetical protein
MNISPNRGGDQGTLTVTIYGGLFGPTPTVTLTRDGESDIPGAYLEQVSNSNGGEVILVRFNLTDAARGTWDLELRRPDGGNASYPGALTVEEATYADIAFHISGDERARVDTACSNSVVIHNLTNNDVGISELRFYTPDGASFLGGFTYGDRNGQPAQHPAKRSVDEEGLRTYRSMIGELSSGITSSISWMVANVRESITMPPATCACP